MIKTLVWGFPKEFASIVDQLERDQVIDLQVWIGTEKRCTHSRKNFMEKDLSVPLKASVRCPDHLYDQVTKDLYSYLEMETRRYLYGQYYAHTMHDFLDHFQQLLHVFYSLLSQHQVEFVLIDKIPHYGEDWILYALARAMGIKCLMLFPSHFPERFFYVSSIEDFGYFQEASILDTGEISIDAGLGEYMGYLKQFKPYQYNWVQAVQDFVVNQQFMAFHKWTRYRTYRKNLRLITTAAPDLERPFVFFPFHLQPELTTFPLGGKFVDQILALERLSELLPEGWLIYAKENLHQSEYMRGQGFFDRLQQIKNLVMVPGEYSSKMLIEKSQWTATITGTVGWESIRLGKKVLVFGQPWYLSLPGMIPYTPTLTFEAIEQMPFPPTGEVLEQAIKTLLRKTGKGTVGRQFMNVIEFNELDNAKEVSQSLSRVIRRIEQREETALATSI